MAKRKRINVEARLGELKEKRRAKTITRAERVELDKLETRIRTLIEWVAEPTDEHGDVIDPVTGDTRDVVDTPADLFRDFPEAVLIDVARVITKGSDAEGVTDREYDYRLRYYRDGRTVQLTTDRDGLTPVEVPTT